MIGVPSRNKFLYKARFSDGQGDIAPSGYVHRFATLTLLLLDMMFWWEGKKMEEKNVINVNSWEEFKLKLDSLRREHGKASNADRSLLFRGQENSAWGLETTLDRWRKRTLFLDYYRVISRIRPQIESFTGKEWLISEYPDVVKRAASYDAFNSDLSCGKYPAYAYMAYLRHHGFPSPLLDWSRSPYIAAHFAFSKVNEKPSERVSIFVLSKTSFKLHGNGMRLVYYPGQYVNTHRRHFLQQSEYTLCLEADRVQDTEWRFEQYHTVFNDGHQQQGICKQFTIPAAERAKVLHELNEYNINAFSLFGSEESLMDTLATREFCFSPQSSE